MARETLEIGGLFNSFSESKTPKGRAYAMQNCDVSQGIAKGSARYASFGSRTGADANDVCYGLGHGKYSSNEIQRLTVTGTPTGGTLKITWGGQETGTIVYNATATIVLTALEALSNIGIGDVSVSGGPWPSAPIDVKFIGANANTDVGAITLTTNSLTGGTSPSLTITERIKGGSAEIYLCAIKNSGDSTATMYSVDAATGVYTSVATGLTASAWSFQQYKDKIFAVNATDGLNYFRLGGSWNDGTGSSKPKAPVVPPVLAYTLAGSNIDFSTGFASIAQSGLGGAPTVTGTASGISITNGAVPVTAYTEVTITATYTAAQDIQFNDIWRTMLSSSSTADAAFVEGYTEFKLVNNDGSPLTISPITTTAPLRPSVTQVEVYHHFANGQRTSRDNILKFTIKFAVDSWPASKQVVVTLKRGLSWMASKVTFQFY